MKSLFTILTCLCSFVLTAQTKYFTKSANVSFYSVADEEKIEAHNNRAISVFELESGKVEFSVLIKSFQFEKALMQEHFNENYMESDKYPKATFKGSSEDIKNIDFTKDGEHVITLVGDLTIHGVTKNITEKMTITIKAGKISGLSEFKVKLKDYNVKIPSVVGKKIAEEILIKVDVKDYQKLTK